MGSKATWRAINASIKRAERNARTRQRELQKRQQHSAKMSEQSRNQHEVEVYENYVELITSIHKECSPSWDWEAIAQSDAPAEPAYLNQNELVAQKKLESYKPGLFDKIFGQDKKAIALRSKEVERARQKDQAVYKVAMEEYRKEYTEWKSFHAVAVAMLAKDLHAYGKAIHLANPFADMQGVGSKLEFPSLASWYIEVILHVNGDNVIPAQEKSLLKSGKVSTKAMSIGRRNEIYQDYVCGCVLRVARELLALLPIDMVIVHAMGQLLDSSTGHKADQTILSIAIPRSTLSQLNFETIDCSDAMKNFVHEMNFMKTKGFAPVEKIVATRFAQRT